MGRLRERIRCRGYECLAGNTFSLLPLYVLRWSLEKVEDGQIHFLHSSNKSRKICFYYN